MKFFKLIRWVNISIVILSMSMVLLFVISPLLDMDWFQYGLCPGQFMLLVSATIFIAIAGNILNDIYDINADGVNKPGGNIVGRKISLSTAWTLYWIFTIGGILLGTFLSHLVNQINYGLIFLFSSGLLWFYSQKYQCQPLIGNIVVSALSALSFGLVWLFQFFALSNEAEVFASVQTNFGLINRMVLIYMAFAFVTSFLREIVKDIQDYKGDERFGCRTFAVVYGFAKAKRLLLVISYLFFVGFAAAQFYFLQLGYNFHFWYFMIIDILLGEMIRRIHIAREPKDFSNISMLIKLTMLAGILSMAIFYFY